MTEAQKKAYLKAGGSTCPYCGSADIAFDSLEAGDGPTVIQEVGCENCQAVWREIYMLTDVDD